MSNFLTHGLRGLMLGFGLAILAACNTSNLDQGLSTQNTSTQTIAQQNPTPSQTVGTENALAPSTPATAAENALNNTSQSVASGTQVAALNVQDSVAFLPVTGAPQTAVTKLSRSLRESAIREQLPVVPANQPGARYQVKGYFTALSDGSGTLLVYVWDVFDASGKRLHRINGQERASNSSTDPWQSVTANEYNAVANATVSDLSSWLRRSTN